MLIEVGVKEEETAEQSLRRIAELRRALTPKFHCTGWLKAGRLAAPRMRIYSMYMLTCSLSPFVLFLVFSSQIPGQIRCRQLGRFGHSRVHRRVRSAQGPKRRHRCRWERFQRSLHRDVDQAEPTLYFGIISNLFSNAVD